MEQIINNVIKFMYFTLFVTVLITAVVLVVAAYVIAKLIGPRSYNPVKGEPFECGIPTHGSSWLPMHVGYYLFPSFSWCLILRPCSSIHGLWLLSNLVH